MKLGMSLGGVMATFFMDKDGAIVERVDRQERTGATWRDLESARVLSRLSEHEKIELINQDSSVGEFLDPKTWNMASRALGTTKVAK